MQFATVWIELDSIVLSVVNQKNYRYWLIFLIPEIYRYIVREQQIATSNKTEIWIEFPWAKKVKGKWKGSLDLVKENLTLVLSEILECSMWRWANTYKERLKKKEKKNKNIFFKKREKETLVFKSTHLCNIGDFIDMILKEGDKGANRIMKKFFEIDMIPRLN